jgi:hypothetical protein
VAAPQHGPNTGYQFARVEWFGQIVVCADFKAYDAIHIFASGGEQKHRQARSGSKAAQHFKAVNARQHYIEHNQQVIAFGGALQTTLAIVGRLYRESLGLQVFAYERAKFHVVVDNKNAFHDPVLHCAPEANAKE